MKKVIITLIILGSLVSAGIYFYNAQKKLETYESPDKKYQLIVINARSLFEVTMPGDGGVGSMVVEIILEDANGNIIGKSSSNTDCGILYESVEVVWYIEENLVSYGRGKFIDIKTGEVSC